mgnify:CR=1 FL=1
MWLSTQLRPVEEGEKLRNVILKDFPGKVEYIPEDTAPFVDRLLTESQGGNVTISLVGGLHGDFPPFIEEGIMADLSDLASKVSSAGVSKDFMDLGKMGTDKQYYIPWMQATYIGAANKEALQYLPQGADINKLTYDQMKEWAANIQKETGERKFGLPGGPFLVGLAGVEGNGQRELLRTVAGRLVPLRGRLEVTRPIAFIPEDRTTEGIILELSLTENVVLGLGKDAPWVRHSRIQWREARERTGELLQQYGIVAAGPDVKAGALSGGNQQKLVVARELFRNPAVIVAENPTRGLDVSAAASIHARIRAAADDGAAVLFHSSDLDEVLHLADRVVVVSRGALGEVPVGTSRAEVGNLMLGGESR